MKKCAVFLDVTPCSLLEIDRPSCDMYPKFLPSYTVSHSGSNLHSHRCENSDFTVIKNIT